MNDKYGHGSFGYFHFRLHNAKNREVKFLIKNKDDANTPMPDSNRLYYLYESLFELETFEQWTMFDEKINGVFTQKFDEDVVYISNMFPCPVVIQVGIINKYKDKEHVENKIIGNSYEGRPIHAIIVQDPNHDGEIKDIIISSGTHPGETVGFWKLKGMLDHVLEIIENPKLEFKKNYKFHFIPHASPDGIYNSIHRLTLGEDGKTLVNMNRDFNEVKAIETSHIIDYMDNNLTDVYWTIDLHGSVNSDHWSPIIINYHTREQEKNMLEMQKYALVNGGTTSTKGVGYLAWYPTTLFPKSPSVLLESWNYHQGSVHDIKQSGKNSLSLILEVTELSD